MTIFHLSQSALVALGLLLLTSPPLLLTIAYLASRRPRRRPHF